MSSNSFRYCKILLCLVYIVQYRLISHQLIPLSFRIFAAVSNAYCHQSSLSLVAIACSTRLIFITKILILDKLVHI